MNLFYRQPWRVSQRKLKRRIAQREFRPDGVASLQPDIHPVLQLQQTVGNRSVARLVQSMRYTEQGNLRSIPFPTGVGQAGSNYTQDTARVLHRQLGNSLQLRQTGGPGQTNRRVSASVPHPGPALRGTGAAGAGAATSDKQSPSDSASPPTTEQK